MLRLNFYSSGVNRPKQNIFNVFPQTANYANDLIALFLANHKGKCGRTFSKK